MTDAAMGKEASLHATAVVYGEFGVLILGPSGSGKSALALALMARASAMGVFGALVGDDRIFFTKVHGRLIARGAANMAGVIERRSAGLIAVPYEPMAMLRLAAELSDRARRWPRLPNGDDNHLLVGGVSLPRLAVDSGQSACDQALAVDESLAALAPDGPRNFT